MPWYCVPSHIIARGREVLFIYSGGIPLNSIAILSNPLIRLAHKDRAILDMARAAPFCFDVELVRTERMDVMFEADPGDEEVRGTVHVYRFRRGNGLGGGDWCTNELGQESVGAGQSEVCGN